jgi:hypothetical protein
MTLADYMDPERFPLSTQKGLEPKDQMLIDAINYDDLAEARELGTFDPVKHGPIAAELDAKHTARAEVVAELKARERGSNMTESEKAPLFAGIKDHITRTPTPTNPNDEALGRLD